MTQNNVINAAREFVNGNWSLRITELNAFRKLHAAIELLDGKNPEDLTFVEYAIFD